MTALAPVLYYVPVFSWLRIAEPPPDPLSEADLSLLWAGQRFPAAALATPDGRPVTVLNPGRLNTGPGPDFRDAVLSLDGEEHRGDVELHVRASAFRGHGHHLDPAYDALALHVVYRADTGGETELHSGRLVPVAALAPWLERRTADLQRWLTAPALWQQPCRDAEAHLGPGAISRVLREAGLARFEARVAALEAEIAVHGEETALWRTLLGQLGVGGDRAGFRRLAERWPPSLARALVADLSPSDAAALLEDALLALAGLRPLPPVLEGRLPPPIAPPLLATGRPANRPQGRLAAFARLFVKAQDDLAAYALAGVAEAASAGELLGRWTMASHSGPALLGRERAQELLLNAVLPFAATRPVLRPRVEALLSELGALPAYGKTRFLEANLLRSDGRRRVRSAVEQQGLLGLLDRWCSRDGCGRCPLS